MIRPFYTTLAFFLLLFTTPSCAQVTNLNETSSNQIQSPFNESPPVYYEAFNLPADDTSKSRVDITFRISYGVFIFVKNDKYTSTDASVDDPTRRDNSRRWPFIARCFITVELLDKSEVSVARELVQKEIGTNNPERDANRSEFLQGMFSFTLPPDEYTIVFKVDDLESNKEFLDKSRKVRLRDFSQQPIEVSDILFIEPLGGPRSETIEFVPVNLGGDVFFGRNFDAYIEVAHHASAHQALQLAYSLYKLDDFQARDSTFFVRDSVVAKAFERAKTLDIRRTETSYFYQFRESHARNKMAAILQLHGDQLPQGKYELRLAITDGANSRTQTHSFRVRWINMPRSLQNFEFSITVLEHIASKEEYSELKGPFTKQREEKFQNFWKKQDPTPNTAFNEAMAEYYRRVDYTMENFSAGKSGEGWKTDRGKVYIMYGQPNNTDRKFSPTAPPQEIWTYENLKKRFTFIDERRSGEYKLIATENFE